MSSSSPRGRVRGRRKVVFALAVGVLVAAGLSASVGQGVADAQQAPWLDGHKSVQARVNALLHAMTLPEKVGQMDQQLVGNVTAANRGTACGAAGDNLPSTTCMQEVLINQNTGSILAGGSDNPVDTTGAGGSGNTAQDWANQYNEIQKFAVQNSRLHIPLIFGIDAIHGFSHPWQDPLFPQSIGMGATWDPAAAQRGGVITANGIRATGWNWAFAPVQDLARDNRWGRYYETWAEEPALAGAMGAANIRGMQTPAPKGSLGVAATVKHFAGYSQAVNGHDRNGALLPLNYLQDTILPSYIAGIDAGADTVMVNSGSINGVPATGSHYLLTDILRKQIGFDGVVISDYKDVQSLQTAYHIAPDLAGAIAAAVNAGVDMSMEVDGAAQWQAAILQDVANGAISKHRIDEAVGRILTLKFKLGLFDQQCATNTNVPCVDASKANATAAAGRDATLDAVRESITLLRNQNNTLPLSASSKVVVTGPSAQSMTNQLGGWSVSWQGVFSGTGRCCQGQPDQIPPGSTVWDGVHAADANAVYAPDQASAVGVSDASAYVVAVGEKAYAEALGDNPAPQLPPDQKALISALQATGKPVIVVVIAGRPVGLGTAAEKANGIIMAYQGSTEAGQAIADVVFGNVNPSGKLPISWPSDADAVGGDFNGTAPSPLGDQPKVFDQLPGTGGGAGHAYNPLYPFGFGLSYTTYSTTGLSITPDVSRHGTATATFTVTNTGSRSGTNIVPIYVAQPVSSGFAVSAQRLVGFTRVTLDAGQSKQVSVRFAVSALGKSQGDINSAAPPTVQPGSYVAQLNSNTTKPYDVVASAPFTIH